MAGPGFSGPATTNNENSPKRQYSVGHFRINPDQTPDNLPPGSIRTGTKTQTISAGPGEQEHAVPIAAAAETGYSGPDLCPEIPLSSIFFKEIFLDNPADYLNSLEFCHFYKNTIYGI